MKDKIEEILLRNNNWKADEDEVEIFGVEFSRETMDKVIKELSTLIQAEREEAIKDLGEDILKMSVETADLSFRDGFFKARDIILHNIQEYLDKGE